MASDGMMFRLLLIVAAGIALLAIIMHYNNAVSSPPLPDDDYQSGYYEAFQDSMSGDVGVSGSVEDVYAMPAPVQPPAQPPKAASPMAQQASASPAAAGPAGPAHPHDTIRPQDLLPVVGNTPEEQQFAQLYTTGQGDMQGINFLDAGSQIGLSTRLNRNANLQLRSDPPIIKQPLPFLFSTIEADKHRKPMEIGSSSTAVPVDPSAGLGY
nr:hypothetical protein TetV2_00321 [Oceanusvirus sp.]